VRVLLVNLEESVMRTHTSFSILTAGLLALSCAGGGVRKEAASGGAEPPAGSAPAATAFPADGNREAPTASEPSSSDDGARAGEEGSSTPPPAPAAATGAATERADTAPRSRAEAKKSSRPLELEPERPGLGTTWGETMASHVSNAPFERASSNPFSLTTIHYNDASGVAAMLRGGSLADFRSGGVPAGNGMVTVRLTDGSGTSLPTFAGAGRTLVQGERGQRYLIEIANQTGGRFEAVVTVDGLDVIDGRPGALSKRGYLLQPFATVQIEGFRQNMNEVAAFRFGSVRGSYAAGKGGERNVGVIGVALFSERGAERPWTARELERREAADPFPGRFASPPLAR
jgi:hypothetical protein